MKKLPIPEFISWLKDSVPDYYGLIRETKLLRDMIEELEFVEWLDKYRNKEGAINPKLAPFTSEFRSCLEEELLKAFDSVMEKFP